MTTLAEISSLLNKIGDQQRLIRELVDELESRPDKDERLLERAHRILGDIK